jgi:CTP synthase
VAATKQTKYVFVTGGVLSGLGKGITAASIGRLLKNRGLTVNIQKCDPYLNVDAGTLNPAEHGEVFVTKDGAETDLDLGHYERYLDQELDKRSSLMSGRILSKVIADERAGEYLGKTVQIIPHVTEAIQEGIVAAAEGVDVHIVELGGTVGDYEGLAFVEAIREMRQRVGAENTLYVHVVYLPYLGASQEFKTKPAQNATKDLRALGVIPDVLVARSEMPPVGNVVNKLSTFCGVPKEGIALLPNAKTVYEIPNTLEETGVASFIAHKLGLKDRVVADKSWRELVKQASRDEELDSIKVGVVAKYMDNEDTYMSVFEALRAAGWKHEVAIDIEWIDAESLEKSDVKLRLSGLDGIVVPGGFGSRGVEGKIKAASLAIDNKIPYLGLCLGMQVACIALARKAIDEGANSIEINPETTTPVISLMTSQKQVTSKGGTMRLGDYECILDKESLAYKLYGKKKTIVERHRHRYEFNNQYRKQLTEAGMRLSGLSPDGELVELVEIDDHPFFVASQYHPEFKSRPNKPHPMFDGFVAAIINKG